MSKQFLREPRLVIDTGPMWYHAMGYVDRTLLYRRFDRFAAPDHFTFLDGVIRSGVGVHTTPYVICELHARVQRHRSWRLERFMHRYRDVLLQSSEVNVGKDRILLSPRYGLGPTDVSVLLAAGEVDAGVLTTDRPMARAGRDAGLRCYLYEDVFRDWHASRA